MQILFALKIDLLGKVSMLLIQKQVSMIKAQIKYNVF